MNFSRRGLLKILPAAPMAVSLAQAEAVKMVSAGVGSASLGPVPYGGNTGLASASVPFFEKLRGQALAMLLRTVGIPEWKRKEIRQNARYSRQLDPDIAALQSVSLAAKLNMQWRRNEAAAEKSMFDYMTGSSEREDWMNTHNTDWF